MKILYSFIFTLTFASCYFWNNEEQDCSSINSRDSIAVFQACLNSPELQEMYFAYGDTTLTILGNGYVRTSNPLVWNKKATAYVSPQRLRQCLSEAFIIQFTKFDIITQDNVEVSLWLQRQGSGADFSVVKKKDKWFLKKIETYLN